MEYPTIYASAKNGWAIDSLDKDRAGVKDLLEAIVDHVPAPKADTEGEFTMLIT